jgi:NTE family protein
MPIIDEIVADRKAVWDNPPRPKRIGLVLGGGAARGIAHIGALQVLEENGIYPQVITGTSVGALVGGLYAAGISAARLVSIVENIDWLDLVSFRFPTFTLTDLARNIPMGLVDLDKMIDWIDQEVGAPVTFDQLNVPFAAVATDLVTGQVVVMNEGLVAPAIRASCSLPGVFTPYRRNGRLLVDGVVVNNMPVTIAQDLGADYTIGIDLLPLMGERQAEPRNVVEVAITALFTLARATQIEQLLADVIISPAIAHVNLADLNAAPSLLEAGRRAMEGALPTIREAVGMP